MAEWLRRFRGRTIVTARITCRRHFSGVAPFRTALPRQGEASSQKPQVLYESAAIFRRTEPPQPWAGELDALAVRLDAAAEILDGVHPNYWAYRAELAAITDAVADVVRRYNASGTASA